MKILCFHNPDEENGYLSNWYLSEFNVSNITFSSMEQFMMYQKAMCFCDQTIAKKILTTHDVAQIKKSGGKFLTITKTVGMASDKSLYMRDCLQSFLKTST